MEINKENMQEYFEAAITGLQNQRNNALNEAADLHSKNTVLTKQIEKLNLQLGNLQAQIIAGEKPRIENDN